MLEVNNVLRIGKETRESITIVSRICKENSHLLCPEYKKVALHLVGDWRTMIKNQRRSALQHMIMYGGCDQYTSDLKQRFILDPEITQWLQKKERMITVFNDQECKMNKDLSEQHYKLFISLNSAINIGALCLRRMSEFMTLESFQVTLVQKAIRASLGGLLRKTLNIRQYL